jgi:cytochrome P450
MIARTIPHLLEPPEPAGATGLRALQAMWRRKTILAALEVFHADLGDIFRITLPGFRPIMLAGPEAARFVLVSDRGDLRWRTEGDPVTRLLRRGVLVTDGDEHDALRREMDPALHRRMLAGYVAAMLRGADRVTADWADGASRDMLVEMRRAALLILTETLFGVDLAPDLTALWPSILKTLAYISPGLWIIWRGAPRPGYARALRQMDEYLYHLIAARRARAGDAQDLLGGLIASGMSDDLIRDQLLTMLIAGHDTSTALLAWALYLLGRHPDALARARAEVDAVLGSDEPTIDRIGELRYLDRVVKEALRLYPPIHVGTRTAAMDLEFNGYRIPAGARVLYSIYLTHRDPRHWPDPHTFDPDRFLPERARERAHYTYLPFGGGPRICIGFAFAEVEARIVLARLLQQFDLQLERGDVHPHMGATLEPRPGVRMHARRR